MRLSPMHGARFVSQSSRSSAAGATAVTDVHDKDSHGHAEVNPYEEVSYSLIPVYISLFRCLLVLTKV